MNYTIYKITNLINNKYYIGKHKTDNLDDGYMGSGKLIKRAIEKYGLENFKKEILFDLESEELMNFKEAELVIISEETYNLCPGGRGGFGYINSDPLLRISSAGINKVNDLYKEEKKIWGKKWAERTHEILRTRRKNGEIISNKGFSGRKHSEETKSKMKKSKNSGENNPQFGSKWITNGISNKKIKFLCDIPEGWRLGRIIKSI